MAKPNDTSTAALTEPSPRFIPLLPTSQANRFPRNATLYLDSQAPRGQLIDSARARLRSAINLLALTQLLDEDEEPGSTLAYINGSLMSLVSDALSELEAAHDRE